MSSPGTIQGNFLGKKMTQKQEVYEILENAPFGFRLTKSYLSKVLNISETRINNLLRQCTDIYDELEEIKLVDWHKFSPEPSDKRMAELNFIYNGLGECWKTNLNRWQILPMSEHTVKYKVYKTKTPGVEKIYKVIDLENVLYMTLWQIDRLYKISPVRVEYLVENKISRGGLLFEKTELDTTTVSFTYTDEEVDLLALGYKDELVKKMKKRRMEEWRHLIDA